MSEPKDSGGDSEPVPKLPFGRGMKFSTPEIFRIVVTIGFLIAVVVLTKPCSHAVSNFVMGFQGSGSGSGSAAGSAESQLGSYGSATLIPLRGMNDDQVRQTVERAQHRGTGSGSGAGSD